MHLSRTDMKDKLTPFFITFGGDSAFKDNYIEIWSCDSNEAREVAYSILSNKWAFIYEEKAFELQITQYGLVCLAVIKPNDHLRYALSYDQPHFEKLDEEATPNATAIAQPTKNTTQAGNVQQAAGTQGQKTSGSNATTQPQGNK